MASLPLSLCEWAKEGQRGGDRAQDDPGPRVLAAPPPRPWESRPHLASLTEKGGSEKPSDLLKVTQPVGGGDAGGTLAFPAFPAG